ncbi:MAG: sigma-54-dependent Fis family transcriptional regulator [Deltaproteobacteria bacterium]|nr:sigma-54-dependent Fis family transcriptional regulator [Deltaproteobacteria bacterium]
MGSRALVIDDDRATRFALRLLLEREEFIVAEAATGEEGLTAALQERPDVVFLDMAMPGIGGLDVLETLTGRPDAPPVVMITGVGTPESAIRAVQLGAYEYLTKPLDASRVRLLARRAVELHGLKRELDVLRRPSMKEEEPRLVGSHPSMQEVYKAIGRVTATPERTTVLVLGETGTGKELVSRAIHRASRDRDRPFVVVNCAALPEALIESELFGHERGAFTGASERRIGKVELAGEGTLFADEVSSLTPALQQRFLRLLQAREFERVGGREVLPARARFVAACNVDLEAEVRAVRFREDLYFRLSVFPIVLPPLRERFSDLPLLVEESIRRFNARLERQVAGLGPGTLAVLHAHRWPGNVRELENVIHHAMLRATGDFITVDALPGYLRTDGAASHPAPQSATPGTRPKFEQARREAIEAFERAYLASVLEECGGNVTEAARRTGMRRTSLQRLLKRHGLTAAAFRQSDPPGAGTAAPSPAVRGAG